MNGHGQETTADGKYDYRAFPENLELARNIEQRLSRRGTPSADGPAAVDDSKAADGPRVVREIADLQRYMTELYGDIRAGDREAAMNDSVNIATSAFVISRILAPDFYEKTEGIGDVGKFMAKMGDSVAMNEIDVDLGTGRWMTATDLIMDMLSALSVMTGTLAIEAESEQGYIRNDLDFNVITGCALIAAYAQIVYQCAKNGSYRGQVLKDLMPVKA